MKKLPIAFKILLNIVFFVIYAIILINLLNFLYDLYIFNTGKVVPPSDDIIHIKIAGIVGIFTLIFTLIFRKYFYISILNNKINNVEIKKENKIKAKKSETVKKDDDLEIFIGRDKSK